MVLPLALAALASVLCAITGPGGWRHRVHHALPVPAMALGMGAGLLSGLAAAAVLWVVAAGLERRGRRGLPVLRADAADCAAMAVALAIAALATSAAGTAGSTAVTAGGVHGAMGHGAAVHSALTGAGGPADALVWSLAALLAVAVLTTRVVVARLDRSARGCPAAGTLGAPLPHAAVSALAGALMATATALMLLG